MTRILISDLDRNTGTVANCTYARDAGRPSREWRGKLGHPLFNEPADFGKAAVFQITNTLAAAEPLQAVADLSPDDPRREYANAAQFMGRAKRWADDYRGKLGASSQARG